MKIFLNCCFALVLLTLSLGSWASQSGWCATKNSVSESANYLCKYMGGEFFISQELAKAAHKRLNSKSHQPTKGISLTIQSNVKNDEIYIDGVYRGTGRLLLELPKGRHAISIRKSGYESFEKIINLTAPLTLTGNLAKVEDQPAPTNTPKATTADLDLAFWQSIKDSYNPEMFEEYLRQFPTGTYAGLARITLKQLREEKQTVEQPSVPDLEYGEYFALVIGNNHYEHLDKLSTAINDAKSIAGLLRSEYGFKVDLLTDAKRDEVVSALSRLRKVVSPNDNLLIYYAGHGWLDTEMDEGFWLPVDANEDDQVNWIANDTITRSVRAIKAKHVMVVADSCFSGTLTRGVDAKVKKPDYIDQMVNKKARVVLTSGGLEPVSDTGGGNHSVFAKSFIQILNQNPGVLDGHQFYSTLRKKVMLNADQSPEYGEMRKTGHEGGDFLFVRR